MHFMNAISPVVYWDSRVGAVGARVGARVGAFSHNEASGVPSAGNQTQILPALDVMQARGFGQRFRPEVSARNRRLPVTLA